MKNVNALAVANTFGFIFDLITLNNVEVEIYERYI